MFSSFLFVQCTQLDRPDFAILIVSFYLADESVSFGDDSCQDILEDYLFGQDLKSESAMGNL